MSEPAAWSERLRRRREAIDAAVSAMLKLEITPHSPLADAVRYCMQPGGKRLRPALVLECAAVCGGSENQAWPAALAIECAHAFSLIHDDLPAMDDDDVRRGRPTAHRRFDEATAILAGDWLLSKGFSLLLSRSDRPARAAEMAATLAEAVCGMIAGQAADVSNESAAPSVDVVTYIHEQKTGRLFEAACRMGGLAAEADAPDLERLSAYGRLLGLAFQITDDLLDLGAAAGQLGRPGGQDAQAGKMTFPAVLGESASRARVAAAVESAVAALEPFGERAGALREWVRQVGRRA